ncbi:MAG: DNA topoisomerase VI subunit B, partial [Vulcanisaeta sp. AZ3]
CSTKIPYASAGKEAIAEVPEIESEVRNAIREVARKLKLYITRKEKEQELLMKYAIFKMYGEEVANSLSYISKADIEELRSIIDALIKRKLGIERFEDILNGASRETEDVESTEEFQNHEPSS